MHSQTDEVSQASRVSIAELSGESSNDSSGFSALFPDPKEFQDLDASQGSFIPHDSPVKDQENTQEDMGNTSGITRFEGDCFRDSIELSVCDALPETVIPFDPFLRTEAVDQSSYDTMQSISHEEGDGGVRRDTKFKPISEIVTDGKDVRVTFFDHRQPKEITISKKYLDELEETHKYEEAAKHFRLSNYEFRKVTTLLDKSKWGYRKRQFEKTLPVDGEVQTSKGKRLRLENFREMEKLYTKTQASVQLEISIPELTRLHQSLGMEKWDHIHARAP